MKVDRKDRADAQWALDEAREREFLALAAEEEVRVLNVLKCNYGDTTERDRQFAKLCGREFARKHFAKFSLERGLSCGR